MSFKVNATTENVCECETERNGFKSFYFYVCLFIYFFIQLLAQTYNTSMAILTDILFSKFIFLSHMPITTTTMSTDNQSDSMTPKRKRALIELDRRRKRKHTHRETSYIFINTLSYPIRTEYARKTHTITYHKWVYDRWLQWLESEYV